MAMINKTKRNPNYYKDIKTFGKCGEDDFLLYYKNRLLKEEYQLYDVRKLTEYQYVDIDFIITKENKQDLPPIESVLKDKTYIKIEVKYNTKAMKTGYIAYELSSQGSTGWAINTQCDFIYQVFGEEDSLNIINRAWIDMNKWHDYVKSRDRMDTKDNYCFNKENNDRFFDLLCNMKDMENKGIIKFINIIN